MRSLFYKTFFCITLLGFFVAPSFLFADTLSFSPATGSYTSGRTFPVTVFVSSPSQAINALSGEISFPPDKLQLVSISKTGSILTLWVQEPTFSNTAGTVSFAGVVPNPGFTGSVGNILTLNFKVVGQGSATVKFNAGEVLANDGNGTNILKRLNNGSYTLGSAPIPVPEPPPVPPPTPAPSTSGAPVIVSLTYPNSTTWYRETTGEFSWKISKDVIASRGLLNKIANSDPTNSVTPPISSKEINNIEDGVWYFHVGLKTAAGWGPTGHYLFKIDTTAPESFTIKEVPREDKTNPQPKFLFSAIDLTSGINRYTVTVDSGTTEVWKDDGTGIYQSRALPPGEHTILARAYDEAGNSIMASADFYIKPIDQPVITSYTEKVTNDNPVVVSGTVTPGVSVRLVMQKTKGEPIEIMVSPDDKGNFIGEFAEPLTRGVYKLWAIAVDDRGAQSEPTSPKIVLIQTWWGARILSLLSVFIPLLALLFLLALLIMYGIHRLRMMQKKMKREFYGIERMADDVFILLKKGIEETVGTLDQAKNRRGLNEDEQSIHRKLQKKLDEAEEAILKIKQAEKEIDE